MTFALRDYQTDAVEAAHSAWGVGRQRVAVVMATGLGKTPIIGEAARRHVERHRGTVRQRVLVLAHREELIEHAAEKVRTVSNGTLRVGVVKAERRNYTADVVVASVQTARNARALARIVNVGLVIVDECHHATATSYRTVMQHYGCFEVGGARALGLTATLTRADGARLGDVWEDVVFKRDILWGIEHGHLVYPHAKQIYVSDLDLSRVRKSAGDFSNGALGQALEGSMAPKKVAEAYREFSADKQGILFAPTVHSAQVYGEALAESGFESVLVHGAMDSAARRSALERFRRGNVQILTNCMVLTEGTDLPMAHTAIIGRPTKSQGLYVQMVGRVLRPAPGKSGALVLDVIGASKANTLSTPVHLDGKTLDVLDLERPLIEPEPEVELEAELGVQGSDQDEREPDIYVDGHLHAVDINLFRGSRSDWLQTYGGVWFLPAGDRLIVLRPQVDGRWSVMWCHKYARESGWIASDVADLGYAMAHGEGNVSPGEKISSSLVSSWRRGGASAKQVNLAARYGIPAIAGMTNAGELSQQINRAIASQRIDAFAQHVWGR